GGPLDPNLGDRMRRIGEVLLLVEVIPDASRNAPGQICRRTSIMVAGRIILEVVREAGKAGATRCRVGGGGAALPVGAKGLERIGGSIPNTERQWHFANAVHVESGLEILIPLQI